jgi:hypothetical protein
VPLEVNTGGGCEVSLQDGADLPRQQLLAADISGFF